MKPTFEIQEENLIVSLFNSEIDASFIEGQMKDVKHLIFDLSQIDVINDEVLQNFTTFGNQLTKINSFVIVLDGSFKAQFPIVPTLEEAFDYIEMENIERSLNF